MLASQKDDRNDALRMCRLITKPVQLQPACERRTPVQSAGRGNRSALQRRSPTVDRQPIDLPARAQRQIPDTDPVALQTLRWFTARQRPTLVATGVQWMWNLDPDANTSTDSGNWIDAQVDVDLYNPAGDGDGNQLAWTTVRRMKTSSSSPGYTSLSAISGSAVHHHCAFRSGQNLGRFTPAVGTDIRRRFQRADRAVQAGVAGCDERARQQPLNLTLTRWTTGSPLMRSIKLSRWCIC